MKTKESKLVEKAREFEELLETLEDRQVFFSKKHLENYHSKLESEMDENMLEFEDALMEEISQKIKKNIYSRLSEFLEKVI